MRSRYSVGVEGERISIRAGGVNASFRGRIYGCNFLLYANRRLNPCKRGDDHIWTPITGQVVKIDLEETREQQTLRVNEMSGQRKRHSAEFKAKVAVEALKGLKTVQQLAKEYGVHPTQISQWKQRLKVEAPGLFGRGQASAASEQQAEVAALYEKIGRLNMEVDWLKKKVSPVG